MATGQPSLPESVTRGLATRPRARAGNAKDLLAYLEVTEPAAAAHLRRALPRAVLDAVELSARTDWNDLGVDRIYVAEIVRFLGHERARQLWRRFASQRFVRTPAIRALTEGAVRLFGLSVGSLVRVVPLAFQQAFRHAGEVSVTLANREATVVIEHLAPEVDEAYLVLFHGTFLGIYDLVKAPPQLEFRAEPAARQIVARFRW